MFRQAINQLAIHLKIRLLTHHLIHAEIVVKLRQVTNHLVIHLKINFVIHLEINDRTNLLSLLQIRSNQKNV